LLKNKSEEIPEYLFELAFSLSTLCNELFQLKSAMLNLNDIMHINKYVIPDDIKNFFILMEVYGGNYDIDMTNPKVLDHKKQRNYSI
jgi:hypothetical protein